jgi:transposase
MTRPKNEQLRELKAEECAWLEKISRSQSEISSHVIRAKQILGVATGYSYTEAAHQSGCKCGDTVSKLVARFNQEGLAALQPRYEHHHKLTYGVNERERILREARRKPEPSHDGTATWSLSMLCQAIRKAPDGLPKVSEDTIRNVLLEAGFSWQKSRTWCETGQVVRNRKAGKVSVNDPDSSAKKIDRKRLSNGRKDGISSVDAR